MARRNHYEPSRVALRTTPGADAHSHVATFDDDGNGITSEAPDGHWHVVHFCDVLPAQDGHTHDLTSVREEADHDAPTWRPGRGQQRGRSSRRAERREAV